VIVHDVGEVLRILHGFTVDGNDEVSADHDGSIAEVGALIASAQARLVGSAIGYYLHNHQA
jgi:hypothetical protein